MTDSLLERFTAVAPNDDRSDWADVRRRARRRRIPVPIAVAAALAALVVAAPAVGLVALLTRSGSDYGLSIPYITIRGGVSNPVAVITGEVRDERIRTVALALDGRPERRKAVGPARKYSFWLSGRDFRRCGAVYGLDKRGYLIAAVSLPPVSPAPKAGPTGTTWVKAPPPSC
jgi:hypothetical protein